MCAQGLQGEYITNLLAKATEMSVSLFWWPLPTFVKERIVLFYASSLFGSVVRANDFRLRNNSVFFLRKCIPI